MLAAPKVVQVMFVLPADLLPPERKLGYLWSVNNSFVQGQNGKNY